MLEGDGAVRDRLGAAAGLDEELGQVGAQPDVVGRGLHGACQRIDEQVCHPLSLGAGGDTNTGADVWYSSVPLVGAVHGVMWSRTDARAGNLPILG